MIVYKVVRKKGEQYYSCNSNQDLELNYKIGKVVVPKIGKIFVFKELKYARFFTFASTMYSILECETSEKIEKLNFRALCDTKSIKDFWSGNYKCQLPWNTPDGTYIVNSLTPLRIID